MAVKVLPVKTVGSGQDTIALSIAEDAYQGDAQFSIMVDGVQVGDTQTALASKAQGEAQTFNVLGDFGSGPHTVSVSFLNDAWGGTPDVDRNLYVLGAMFDGAAQPGRLALYSTETQSLVVQPGPVSIGSGPDAITLSVQQDAFRGNAQFTVSVDGTQIGGPQTALMSRLSGLSQTFSILGEFGAGEHSVSVDFLNDAWDGDTGGDRNLFVQAAAFGGVVQSGRLAFYGGGAQSMVVQPGPVTVGSGRNTITLSIAEDAYRGNAQFTVSVDGTQIGGIQTALVSRQSGSSQAFSFLGDFGAGPHKVGVNFLNDAWDGSVSTDRNLYVLGATFDGAAQSGNLSLYGNGTQSLTVMSGPVSVGSGSDTIELSMAEDAYQGNAQFLVSVDGVQIGTPLTVLASKSAGAVQLFDINGNFGTGTHTVSVNFINDAWGGTTSTDRNLYVTGVTYNGVAQQGAALSLYSSGTQSMTIRQPTASGLSLLGVNLSGAEYGNPSVVGNAGTDYILPSTAEVDYYAAKGFNIIRLPFLWERMQPIQGGPLNPTYLNQIDQVVNYANAKGLKVDLDLHNYGIGYGDTVGSTGTPASSLNSLWSQLAGHYAQNSNVLFGIMNEPFRHDAESWATIENGVVQAIRQAGATSQEILASGTGWDSGTNWTASGNAAVLASMIHDPNHNLAFEVHQYFDADSSGTTPDVVSQTIGAERLADVTNWAQTHGVKLFLGEFGSGPDVASLATLNSTLGFLQQHNDVWQGGTVWSGGPWWGNYPMSVEPTGTVDKPQIEVLTHYLAA